MRDKLIWKNARHSIKDYVIYLLTVLLSLSLVYSFNMLVFSKELLELSSGLNALTFVVIFISIIVVLVIGWLIHYMTKFIMEKRSREFGLYMLLGIPDKTIISVFTKENMVLGGAAFLGSLITGSILYQILSLVIIRLFHATYQIHMVFSLPALLLTLLYAALMYGSSMIRLRRYLKKVEINDLLYAEKTTESISARKEKRKVASFLFYLVICIAGSILLYACCQQLLPDRFAPPNSEILYFFLALAAICIGIRGIYCTATFLIAKAFLSGHKNKYTGSRLFLLRGLTAKLHTIGKTIGTIALLLTLTLTAAQMAILFENFFRVQSDQVTGFEIALSSTDEQYDYSKFIEGIEKNYNIVWEKKYPLYLNTSDHLYELYGENSWMEGTPVLAWSDFKELWAELGHSPLKLKDNHYLLISNEKVQEQTQNAAPKALNINNTTLNFQTCRSESFNLGTGFHGNNYVAVVSDSIAEALPVYHTCYAIQTDKPIMEKDANAILKPVFDELGGVIDTESMNVLTTANKTSITIIFAFSLFYVGLIFACTAAAILAVQQLSDGVKYQYRYQILSKLGMNRRCISQLIFRQIVLYFFIPVCIPIILSIYISSQLNDLLLLSLSTNKAFWGAAAGSIGLFLLVYLLYFTATYLGYKKKVIEGIE